MHTQGQFLGTLEKEVMDIIWSSKQELAVKTVHGVLSVKRKIAYTTVMTIMGRLETKGILKKKVSGKAFLYQPVYSKDKFLTKISRQIIKNFVSNFGESAIAHFAQEVEKLTPDKQKKLHKLLEEAKNGSQ